MAGGALRRQLYPVRVRQRGDADGVAQGEVDGLGDVPGHGVGGASQASPVERSDRLVILGALREQARRKEGRPTRQALYLGCIVLVSMPRAIIQVQNPRQRGQRHLGGGCRVVY